MAKFCTKCGSPTHPDFGLCPKCDAQKIADMIKYPKFCSECGGRIEQVNGNCTQCGKSYAQANPEPVAEVPAVTEPVIVAASVETPTVEETPVAEVPDVEIPVAEEPVIEEPAEEPAPEEPVIVAVPVETPTVEEQPIAEEPVEETPAPEAPVAEAPAEAPAPAAPVVPVAPAPAAAPVKQPAPPAKPTQAQKTAKKAKKQKPQKQPKPKKEKKVSAGTVIITVLMSIFLFVFTLVGVVLFSVRQFANEDSIEQIIDDVAISDILGIMGEDYRDSFYDTLGDFIKEETGEEISPKKLEKMVEGTTIKPFIAGKLTDYVNDFLYDEKNFELSEKEIQKLMNKNSKAIEEELGAEVSEEVLNAIADWLVNEDTVENLRPATLKKDQPVAYYAINVGLSWITLILIAIVILLCIVTMLRNSLSQAAIGGGVVFIILGGLTSIAAVITIWMPSLISGFLGGDLIGAVVQAFFSSNIIVFAVILAVGILALVARKITLVALAKRKKV